MKRTYSYQSKVEAATCAHCAEPFSYMRTTGAKRRYCGDVCQAAAKQANKAALAEKATVHCSTDHCDGMVVLRTAAGVCEACYCFRRRTGSARVVRLHRKPIVRGDGYRAVYEPRHPLADKSGYVFEHRKVAFESNRGACPGCHWCAVQLTWPTAVVDHLNDTRGDNEPSNLVVSCNDCNRWRGSLITFLSKIQPERFEQLVELMRESVRRPRLTGAA